LDDRDIGREDARSSDHDKMKDRRQGPCGDTTARRDIDQIIASPTDEAAAPNAAAANPTIDNSFRDCSGSLEPIEQQPSTTHEERLKWDCWTTSSRSAIGQGCLIRR
jgi:hypothetical protein